METATFTLTAAMAFLLGAALGIAIGWHARLRAEMHAALSTGADDGSTGP